MTALSILVVDDHPVVRDGLTAILSTAPRFEVVGQAADATAAVRLASKLQPDVAIVDLELPPTDGIDAIREVLRASPATKVLVFTAYKNEERVLASLRAGAHGYLLKGTPGSKLFEAIDGIVAGKPVFESEVAQLIVRHVENRSRRVLTDRQEAIIALLARGLSNREIADALKITERTVKYHFAAIFDRLGVTNRTQALAVAIEMELVKK